jgi:hypothetical protein
VSCEEYRRIETRRAFFRSFAGGFASIPLAQLMAAEGRTAAGSMSADNPLAARKPHFAPTAKNVIFLFMSGGPSQLDLFDSKPALKKWHGQALPPSMTKDLKLAFLKPTATLMASPRQFQHHGRCGTEVSDYLPRTGAIADDICLIRSMHTDAINHDPGELLLTTGTTILGRPTMGSWVTYGLGTECQDLPGFVVLSSGGGLPSAGANNWAAGFLPSTYQGTPFRSSGDPILYLSNPAGVNASMQRVHLDALRQLNEKHYQETGDAEIASRVASYELAFRMQTAGPELLDFSREPATLQEAYGINRKDEQGRAYAVNCLLARRLVERGVRFVMLTHANWDFHFTIDKRLKTYCDATDQPTAALVADLKQRGLLDSTLVIWGGEFGRTPMGEPEVHGGEPGRDHHASCYSMWLAGGGIRGGQVIGTTDELGLHPVEDPVHVHDLQATILHCLGLKFTDLTYRHMGRDFRLTDVGGRVVPKLLGST